MSELSEPALRVLVAVPFSPRRDAAHGGRVVSQLLLRLADRHRIAVVYLRGGDELPIDSELAERCDVVEEVALGEGGILGPQWQRRLRVFAAPVAGFPSQVAVRRQRRFRQACVELASDWRPDIIQVETDTIADVGLRLRASGNDAPRILVCHEPGLPAAVDQARTTRGRQRRAHHLDAIGWRRYWSRTLPAFDAIVALTDRDRAEVERAVTGPVVTIGLGIDIPPEPRSAGGHGEPSVLFVGAYQHPPNADAAMRLLRAIMPAARRRLPGLRLMLVGNAPGPELLDAVGPDDDVTGRVSSVTPFLDEAALVVLPISTGGGMRVKLLEALAAGKVVVASPLAAAGLDITDGRELVLADTDEEFVDSIVALVRDDARRGEIGRAARKWARENLSWDSRVAAYERLYRSLRER